MRCRNGNDARGAARTVRAPAGSVTGASCATLLKVMKPQVYVHGSAPSYPALLGGSRRKQVRSAWREQSVRPVSPYPVSSLDGRRTTGTLFA